MFGYHLTSYKNWKGILKKGLVPYHISDHEKAFFPHIKPPVMGIWLWLERLDAISEPMSVAWHCGKKKTNQVVVLSVEYSDEDVWTVYPKGVKSVFVITHNIEWGIKFYENSKATLLSKPVPIERIGFVKLYDWSKYIKIEGENDEQVRREKKEDTANERTAVQELRVDRNAPFDNAY